MMRTPLLATVLLVLMSVPAPAAEGRLELFVSPGGNDGWSGHFAKPNAEKTDGPLATIHAAQQKLRAFRNASPGQKTSAAITLRGGTYFLQEPVNFSADDSGTSGSTLVLSAYENEKPIISGGVEIRGWEVRPDGRWTTTLPDVASGKWDFSQLFVNGERRMRPRLPKKGYYHIANRVPPPADDPKNPKRADDRFAFAGEEVRSDWKNRGDIEVISFHPWFTSMLRIRDVDAAKKVVTFTGHTRTTAGYGQLSKSMRYLVENVGEALSEPGEWYLDRPTGVLTYIPLPGEVPGKTQVIAPRLPQLISIAGTPQAQWKPGQMQFIDLTFAHSNWTTPADGSSIAQAAVSVGAMVTAVHCSDLLFCRCRFAQAGTYGMELGVGCADIIVRDSQFEDLGGGGIKIGTTGLPSAGEAARRITVMDNVIAHLGRIHPAAVGVWIGQATDVAIRHNDIYDLYYTCISSGWVWGYGKTANQNIRIANNNLHHFGQGVLSDMGGIYTLGASPSSFIEGNRIHDCKRDKYGGWGIYYDEGSSGWTSRNNLLYRLHDGGFHQHYGAENIYENNVLMDATEVQWGPSRIDTPSTPGKVVDRTAITFRRNIISGWGAASVVRGETMGSLIQSHTDKLVVDHNCYWNGGKPVKFGPISFEEWQKRGLDKESIIADPKLPKDPDDPKFRVPEDSPAVQLGFKPFKINAGSGEKPDLEAKHWPRWFPPAN